MGEFELIQKLRERLPAAGPRLRLGSGDDAAVTVPGGATATSVDALVEGVHFRLGAGFEPEDVGAKALATALSDLAAMGAEPGEAYVVLGVPPEIREPELLRLADGLAELAAATGTAIAGGDVSRSPVLSLAITVVGLLVVPVVLFLACLGVAMGMSAVANEIGMKLPFFRGRKTQALVLAVGTGVLLLVAQVPYLGSLAIMVLMVLAFGAAIRTRFGQAPKGIPQPI